MKVLRSSCVLLVSSLAFTFAFSATASPVGLIPANAVWRYLSDGTDPGAGWNTLGFNDSAWPVGPAQLGYGEGDETTVVNTPIQRPVTVYFRRGVLIPSGTDLVLRLLRDDGAVVYFNGVEVRRDNLPAGPINSQTLATTAVGGTDETTFFETTIPASAVTPGTNVIAVEVHQNSVTSSDLSFALELIANFNSSGPIVTVTTIDSETREIPPGVDVPLDPAVFRIHRTGPTDQALSVFFSLTGTAQYGADYTSVPGAMANREGTSANGEVQIPAGEQSADVLILAGDDTAVEGTETVVLTLLPVLCIAAPCPVIGSPNQATVSILDNDTPSSNSPPTVWISRPQDGETFAAPANILLRAVASDREDGYEIAVEFFAGTNKIGNATFIPSLCPAPDCPSWDLMWSNVPPGNYTLTAKATDKTGLMTVSAPVHISVISTNPPPERTVVHVVATDPQAAEPYVSSNVTILNNGRFAIRRTGNMTSSIPVSFTLSGTAGNGTDYTFISNQVIIPAGSTQALVNVIPLSDNLVENTETVVLRIEPVFCAAVVPTPPGCYLVGSPTQATITIADRPFTNQPPEVSISSPTNGAVFTAPANITIVAFASDNDNGAASIEFFEGTNSLGFGIPIPTLCPIDAVHCPIGAMLTWPNVPPGNYVLRAKATDNAGAMTFSAPVQISVVPETPGTNRVLVSMGSVWRYNDQCLDLGTAWQSPLYNDSAWASGPAQLGYGDNDEATIISSGPDPNIRCVTAYFRRSFAVSNAAGISQLSGRLLEDDGAAVYLNGVEIFRSNLPAGNISANTLAMAAAENQIVDFTAPANLLVNGHNVIAVEMHQNALSSSDLSFDLELIGGGATPPPTNQPPDVVIVTPHDGDSFPAGTSIFLGANVFTHNAGVQRVDFYRGSNLIGQATGPLPGASGGWGLSWSNPPIGSHVLRAIATDTAGLRGTSAPVNITVFGPSNTNSLPVVRVFASDHNSSEGPNTNGSVNTGRFTFTRTGGISNSLGVFFTLSGTASEGADYNLGTNVVAFPPGSSNVFLFVTPIDDVQAEETETIVLTVIRPPPNVFAMPYNVGLPSNATVFIYDNDTNQPPPPPTNGTLIAAGSVWKYLDNGTDQGTAWRAPSFDDASWASGPAQLGYGDGDEATVVSGGPDPQIKYITTYFRRAFNVSNAASFSDLTVRLLRDDGGAVYLNGVEVFRSNMPTGALNYTTLALSVSEEPSVFYSAPIDPSLLVNGQNVIAVEIHQVNPASTDISFDLEFIGTGGPQPPEHTVVSVVATDSQASELGSLGAVNHGQFAIRRTGNLASSIPVSFVLSGSASNGADYAFISNRVVIPAGATQTLVNVVPLNDNVAEGTETVVLTLESPICPAIFPPPPECYLVGSPGQATVFITDGPSGTNRPPVATWNAPPDGTEYPQGMNILLRASASDPDGTISRVEFRRGAVLIGITTTPVPQIYALMWSNPPVGSHTLTAVAVDNLGARGTSSPVTIIVSGPQPPPTNSTFTLAFNNREGTEGVFFRQYTLDGPVNGGRLLPAPRVVPDDSGEWYYGAEQHQVWRVNLVSGQVQFMQIPSGLPELSWPIGSAFDSIRNRVLVGTLGGEGHLYAYAPASSQWSLVNDLDNHDLDSIVHHAPDDSIYGFEGGYGGTPQLRRFDAAGNLISSIPLPQVPTGITGHSSSSELVSVGQNLVLLIEPNANWPGQAGGESRIYLIDLRTGEVRLTYQQAVPPPNQPPSVAILSPTNGATLTLEYINEDIPSVEIFARAADPDGYPTNVEFFANGTKLGESGLNLSLPPPPAGNPVNFNFHWWQNLEPGSYSLTARVTDNQGATATSAPIQVTLVRPGHGDSDGDGVPNERDQCPNTPPGTIVDAHGCPPGPTNCPPAVQWQASFGGSEWDGGRSVQQTADGGYILGGFSYSDTDGNRTSPGFGRNDYWVVRVDAQGHKLWDRAFGGSDQDVLHHLQQTADGGFILAGESYSGTDGNKSSPNRGEVDFWLVRLDANGNKLWDQTYGGTRTDVPLAMQQTADGGFVLGGISYSAPGGNKSSPNFGTADFWVVRTDANGNKLWDASFGGSNYEYLYSLTETTDGGFLIGGMSDSDSGGNKTSPNLGLNDYWVVRLNSQGQKVWEQTFGGSDHEILTGLRQTSDGGFILAGGSSSPVGPNKTSANYGGADFWLVRLDPTGHKLWEHSYGGGADDYPWGGVALTTDGGFLVGGTSHSGSFGNKTSPGFGAADMWLVRLDGAGTKLWERSFGGIHDDNLRDLQQTSDGGCVLFGESSSPVSGNKTTPPLGDGDYWVLKLGPESAAECDDDGDGVPNNRDECPNTPRGAVVNEHGCSIAQLCPCDGDWKNHGEYVQCVQDRAAEFYHAGLITREQRQQFARDAAKSRCGHRNPRIEVPPQQGSHIRESGYRLTLNAGSLTNCVVECSTDLVNWVPIQTLTLTETQIQIVDPGARNAAVRFYRLRCN